VLVRGLIASIIVVAILALLLPGAEQDGARASRAHDRAKAATVSVGESFERSTRGDGTPIFTAVDLDRGDAAKGTVEIANSGKENGFFILGQADLTDLPGPGGGALSKRLGLTVRDVTRKRKPVTVYRGPLGSMGARSVGFIEPGDTRRYRFTARVNRPGHARPIPGVDHPYAGSAATVRYVWSVVQAAPPARGSRSRKVCHIRPPVLKADLSRAQRLLDHEHLLAAISCDKRR
jgi:hypothetical protein